MPVNERWSNGSHASLSFTIDLGNPKKEHELFLDYPKLWPRIIVWLGYKITGHNHNLGKYQIKTQSYFFTFQNYRKIWKF